MRMTLGESVRMTLFGSSHGPEVGVVVEGIPAGLKVNASEVQAELDRRSPVGKSLATRRQEPDRLVWGDGIRDGVTLGGPLVAYVQNVDVRRGPYESLEDVPRPGHADFPARVRYGRSVDLSGGGIFSGRMTVGIVIAGALVKSWLSRAGVDAVAYVHRIGDVEAPEVGDDIPVERIRNLCSSHKIPCPHEPSALAMARLIAEIRREGDSVGGIVEARVEGLPVGAGEPFFDSLESVLAHGLFSIPAVKGVEFGAGFAAARMRGSEHNDPYGLVGETVRPLSNHAGGILGGLSTGLPLRFRVAIKPTSSIAREQQSISLSTKKPTRLVVKGRHDPCIVPRGVPVVEHLARFLIADMLRQGGFL
jgi:chorismate synthase